MSFISNFIFGNSSNNPNNAPPRQNINPSQRGGLPKFIEMLRVQPSFAFERGDLESGNKVLLPASILDKVLEMYNNELPQPMVFSISLLRNKKSCYVGVLEFSAPEEIAVIPMWIFAEMDLHEGEMVRLGVVDYLPKATFIKIRPHKTEFIELSDPRAILEIHLRNFVCVTKGETITIHFENKPFLIDVLEVLPVSQYNAAILIDTDVNLEFAAPLDYVEPAKKEIPNPGPKAYRMDGKEVKQTNIGTEKEYDPRNYKIPHGIRAEWFKKDFKGQALKIGK